jgi:thiol-disulfide isomerase/thioredoxin
VCLAAKPTVDGLQDDLGGRVVFLHIDIGDDLGRVVARRYGVTLTPTFIVFDAQGEIVHRKSGFPDTDAIRAAVLSPG